MYTYMYEFLFYLHKVFFVFFVMCLDRIYLSEPAELMQWTRELLPCLSEERSVQPPLASITGAIISSLMDAAGITMTSCTSPTMNTENKQTY